MDYLNGVDKHVFQEVVKRVRPKVTISILFASSLNNVFVTSGSWDDFSTGVLEDPHQIAFLGLGETVYWLSVEMGRVSLAPTDKTELLFVIVETGAVL